MVSRELVAALLWVCGVVVLEHMMGHDHFKTEAKEEDNRVPKML